MLSRFKDDSNAEAPKKIPRTIPLIACRKYCNRKNVTRRLMKLYSVIQDEKGQDRDLLRQISSKRVNL